MMLKTLKVILKLILKNVLNNFLNLISEVQLKTQLYINVFESKAILNVLFEKTSNYICKFSISTVPTYLKHVPETTVPTPGTE